MVVLLSGLLPASIGTGRLRWWHVLGALVGFTGAALVPLGAAMQSSASAVSGLTAATLAGYALALVSAAIWASYSVGLRLLANVPTVALTGACALTAAGASIGHLAFETTVWPLDQNQWMIILAEGLGPVGAAFYLWDAAMKHGNIRLLGVLAYVTPLISTVLLVVFGLGQASPHLWIAVCLVVIGAAIATSDQWAAPARER
jgi:drug/metabolite transporter (DMT)-like permease